MIMLLTCGLLLMFRSQIYLSKFCNFLLLLIVDVMFVLRVIGLFFVGIEQKIDYKVIIVCSM